MSFQKYKRDSYCGGGRHRYATKTIYGDITSKVSKVLNASCSICNTKKSMTGNDNTIQAEGLGSFFKNLGRISAKAGKKLATNLFKNPGRALEITSNIASAAATESPKAALSSLPEMINFYHIGKGLYLRKFAKFIPNKWSKKQIDYIPQHHWKILIEKILSITLSFTGIGLIVLPISGGIACALSLGNKVLHKLIINKYNKNKRNMRKTNKLVRLSMNHTGNLFKIL